MPPGPAEPLHFAAARRLRARWLGHSWRPLALRAAPALHVAGNGPGLDWLLARGFDPAPALTSAGWTRLGGVAAALHDALDRAELVLARLPATIAGEAAGGSFLRLPELVDAVLDLPPAGSRWPPNRSTRSNERRVRAAGLSWTLSHEATSFERFWREFYRPYAAQRYGSAAVLRSRATLRARFSAGGIMEVWQGERLVAAELVAFDAGELHCVAVGAVPGEAALRLGVMAATTLFAVELARERGLERVNLGGNLPSLLDPVLASKRFWGVRLVPRPRADHDLLLGWSRCTPAVAGLLARLAPILRTGHGLGCLGSAIAVPGLGPAIPIEEASTGSSASLIRRGLAA